MKKIFVSGTGEPFFDVNTAVCRSDGKSYVCFHIDYFDIFQRYPIFFWKKKNISTYVATFVQVNKEGKSI